MLLMAKRRPKRKLIQATAGNPWPARLLAFRERHDLTQEAAAQLAKVSARAWISWENGDRQPNVGYAQLLTLTISEQDRKKRKK